MKRFFALSFVSIIVLAGCGGGGGGAGGGSNAATLSSIAVTPVDNRLVVGEARQFTAAGTYSDNTTKDLTAAVTWSSSSASVAIAPNGMATAVSAGSATIKAALGAVSGTTTLTVPARSLVAITITPADTTLAAGASRQLTATGTYSDNTSQDLTASVGWSSSAVAVATIASTGRATAVGAGRTTITATLGAISGTTTLNVPSAALQRIDVTPANPSIAAGTSRQFIATGTFSDGTTQDMTASVAWSSANISVATIDANGKGTAVGPGSTTITAALGISGTTTLNVTSATLQSITVTPASFSIAAGTTQQFTATGTFSDGTTQDMTAAVAWSSSATSVAVIDSNGKVTAVGTGTATITGMSGGIPVVSASLTVTPLDVSGTWLGTYTIYDDPGNPSQIGTYNFEIVLNQSGTAVTGTATLRGNMSGQLSATGPLKGNVTGRQLVFSFEYFHKAVSNVLKDAGTALVTDNVMTGNQVIEQWIGAYNCTYRFTLKKQ